MSIDEQTVPVWLPSDMRARIVFLDACMVVARRHGARGLNVTEAGFEVVFEPSQPPPKEKPEDDATPEGGMPTRAQIEADRQRIEKGGLK